MCVSCSCGKEEVSKSKLFICDGGSMKKRGMRCGIFCGVMAVRVLRIVGSLRMMTWMIAWVWKSDLKSTVAYSGGV